MANSNGRYKEKLRDLLDLYPSRKLLAEHLPFDIHVNTFNNILKNKGQKNWIDEEKKEQIESFDPPLGKEHRLGLEALIRTKQTIQSIRSDLDNLEKGLDNLIDQLQKLDNHYN